MVNQKDASTVAAFVLSYCTSRSRVFDATGRARPGHRTCFDDSMEGRSFCCRRRGAAWPVRHCAGQAKHQACRSNADGQRTAGHCRLGCGRVHRPTEPRGHPTASRFSGPARHPRPRRAYFGQGFRRPSRFVQRISGRARRRYQSYRLRSGVDRYVRGRRDGRRPEGDPDRHTSPLGATQAECYGCEQGGQARANVDRPLWPRSNRRDLRIPCCLHRDGSRCFGRGKQSSLGDHHLQACGRRAFSGRGCESSLQRFEKPTGWYRQRFSELRFQGTHRLVARILAPCRTHQAHFRRWFRRVSGEPSQPLSLYRRGRERRQIPWLAGRYRRSFLCGSRPPPLGPRCLLALESSHAGRREYRCRRF